VPTLAEVTEHQAALADLTTLAQADLVRLWRSLDLTGDPGNVAGALREHLPDVLAAYGSAAGTLAADFYDNLRAEAAVSGAYTAMVAPTASADVTQNLVGWGVAPLFATEPGSDPALALSRLAGGLQRAVAGADRGTIITNTRFDPTAVRYARHASANACAFCAMLATRQAVYRSEATAGMSEKFHDDCHCVAVPVWPGQEVPEAPYVTAWREAYYGATEKLGGANDTTAILAEMRQTADLR
jgi:predicted component of type VI protein secretion system